MSEYESLARVLVHEATEAVERDAIKATERGIYTEPWTARELLAMAGVYAVLATIPTTAGGRPWRGAVRRRPRRMRQTRTSIDLSNVRTR